MKFKLPKGKDITGALPVVAGALGAKVVKNFAGKMIKNEKMKKFVPAVPLLVGLILAGNTGALQKIGTGMIAVGGADLAGSLVPALNGLEDTDLTGLFDEPMNDETLEDDLTDMGGPIDGPIDGADEGYGDDY